MRYYKPHLLLKVKAKKVSENLYDREPNFLFFQIREECKMSYVKNILLDDLLGS